jgi:hypothetical protein
LFSPTNLKYHNENNFINFCLVFIQIYYIPHFDICINLKHDSIKKWANMSKLNNEFDFFEMIHIHFRTIITIYKIICIKNNSFID